MIKVFVGKPGTGKTYALVKLARECLNKKQNVYCNFYIAENKLKLKQPHGHITFFDNLTQLYELREGIILIDEIQIYMNSRNWGHMPEPLQYKLQQHRKHGLHIYGAVQNLRRVDTVFRELVNSVFQVHKFGKLFWVTEYEPEDIELKSRRTLSTHFYWFNKIIANAFDTLQEVKFNPLVEIKKK